MANVSLFKIKFSSKKIAFVRQKDVKNLHGPETSLEFLLHIANFFYTAFARMISI